MKKITINISDSTYEKFKLEALEEGKSIPEIISGRIFHKAFSEDVEKSFSEWISNEINKIIKE